MAPPSTFGTPSHCRHLLAHAVAPGRVARVGMYYVVGGQAEKRGLRHRPRRAMGGSCLSRAEKRTEGRAISSPAPTSPPCPWPAPPRRLRLPVRTAPGADSGAGPHSAGRRRPARRRIRRRASFLCFGWLPARPVLLGQPAFILVKAEARRILIASSFVFRFVLIASSFVFRFVFRVRNHIPRAHA